MLVTLLKLRCKKNINNKSSNRRVTRFSDHDHFVCYSRDKRTISYKFLDSIPHSLGVYGTKAMRTASMIPAFIVAVAVIVFPIAGVVANLAQGVLDLNFIDLAAAVQEHSFLAVAFYSPGCGHCRRLMPSWTEAAELLIDRDPPIRLARMDIASQGGRGAWKAFGLQRVPAVKVFVGTIEDSMPYRGHLDATGIAAHLSMLQRDRRRRLEREERLGRRKWPRKNTAREETGEALKTGRTKGAIELESSDVIISLALASSSAVDDASGSAATLPSPSPSSSSFRERFTESVGERGLSLVLFVSKDSPKVSRMLKELLKAAPLLVDNDPPVRVVLADLRLPREIDDNNNNNAVVGRGGGGGGIKKRAGSSGYCAAAKPDVDASTRAAIMAEVGVALGEAPELRVFLDGRIWIDSGIFRGMPTADGIKRHMQWVSEQADLSPQVPQI